MKGRKSTIGFLFEGVLRIECNDIQLFGVPGATKRLTDHENIQ